MNEILTLSNETEIKPSGNGKATWVRLLNVGSEVFDGKKMRMMSSDFIKSVVAEWRKAQYSFDLIAKENETKPYRFPVKINHKTDGSRKGDIVDVKINNNALYAKAEWTEEALKAIESNDYQHVSVGIWPEYTNERGETFGPLIAEFSITEYPRIQSIGTIQDTMLLELSQIKDVNMSTVTREDLDKLELEREKEELRKMQEEKEELEKKAALMEASEDAPKDEEPKDEPKEEKTEMSEEMQAFKDMIKAEILEEVREMPQPKEEEKAEEKEEEAPEVEMSNDEPKEEVTVELSVNAELTKQILMGVQGMLEEFKAEFKKPLKTTEVGFEGSNPKEMTKEELVDKYISEGMDMASAVKKAFKK